MKALVKGSIDAADIGVRDIPRPAPAADELLIRVHACGICGTDLSVYKGSEQVSAALSATFPTVLGHEFTGWVEDLGADVTSHAPGDWVVVNPHLFCGRCAACERGMEEICENRPIISWHRPGGAAEYMVVRATNAYRLPEDTARAVGALAEPLAVAVHGVGRGGVQPGETVVVFGAGPIGALLAIVGLEAGAAQLMVVGLPSDRERLRVIAGWGVKTTTASGPEELLAVFGGRPDVILDASGSTQALRDGLDLLRPGGRIALIGIPSQEIRLGLAEMVLAEKSVIGTRGYRPPDWEQAVEILQARRETLEQVITHHLPLEEYAEAMTLLTSGAAMKILLYP